MTGTRITAAAAAALLMIAGAATGPRATATPPSSPPGATPAPPCWAAACTRGPAPHVPGSAVTTTPAMSSLALARLLRVGRRTVRAARFGEAAAMRGVTWPSTGRAVTTAQKAGSSGSAA